MHFLSEVHIERVIVFLAEKEFAEVGLEVLLPEDIYGDGEVIEEL